MTSAAPHPIAEAEPDGPDDPARPEAAHPTAEVAPRPGLGERILDWLDRPAASDVAACLLYLSFAVFITGGLWPHPATRALASNVNDQALIEWFLAHGTLFWTGDFSLVTDRLNAPDGVNLMSNASHIMHGILMAPVTALFGAPVSFAVLVAANLAGTAAGWYLLFVRTLGLGRGAAFIGAALAGFGPGMISQSNSHLHITAQWLVPPIVWCVIRLTRVRAWTAVVGTGALLGLLVAAQVLLGEEVLFLTALCLGLFTIVYALCRRRWALEVGPRFVGGLAVSAVVGLTLIWYPLWVQFNGAQHTPNAPFGPEFFYADLASFTIFSPLSIAGSPEAGRLATDATEYNTFLGLPLLLVLAWCAIWRWRSPVVVATTVTAVVMTYLSLGPTVVLDGKRTGFPSLYQHIADIPVINGALPTRYALALLPLIGIVLAFALDAARTSPTWLRVAVPLAVVAALIPIAPRPIAVTDRLPVPTFISTGAWQQCVPDGGVMVPVPLPIPQAPDLMRWPAAANDRFAIPEGFFIGPYGPNGKSSIGVYPRPTSILLAEVARTGIPATVTPEMRAQAVADVQYWKADCVALAPVPQAPALNATLQALFGDGTMIEDVWTWNVRGLRG